MVAYFFCNWHYAMNSKSLFRKFFFSFYQQPLAIQRDSISGKDKLLPEVDFNRKWRRTFQGKKCFRWNQKWCSWFLFFAFLWAPKVKPFNFTSLEYLHDKKELPTSSIKYNIESMEQLLILLFIAPFGKCLIFSDKEWFKTKTGFPFPPVTILLSLRWSRSVELAGSRPEFDIVSLTKMQPNVLLATWDTYCHRKKKNADGKIWVLL